MKLQLDPAFFRILSLASMRPNFRTFQYWPRAKILIHHGNQTDWKSRIDKKQAYLVQIDNPNMYIYETRASLKIILSAHSLKYAS